MRLTVCVVYHKFNKQDKYFCEIWKFFITKNGITPQEAGTVTQSHSRWHLLWQHGVLAWRLFRDEHVSPLLKMIPIASLFYIVSPVDILPDVMPIAGQLDDIGLFLLALQTFISLAPQDIVDMYRRQLGLSPDLEEDADIIDVDAEWLDFDEE